MGHKKSFTEEREERGRRESMEARYSGLETDEAEEERRLMWAGLEDQHRQFRFSQEEYLDRS